MINGAHVIIDSTDADRGFLRDVLGLPVQDQGWGRVTQVTLPGGGNLGVYQPRHARPPAMSGS